MSFFFYKRPDHIAKLPGPLNVSDCQKYVERAMSSKSAIPPELSFENVIQNKALPPCSLQDFMDYLVYVAYDAENLQFYLWLENYTQRFAAAPVSETCLSPECNVRETPRSLTAAAKIGPRMPQKNYTSIGLRDLAFANSNKGSMSSQGPLGSSTLSSTEVRELTVAGANAQVGLLWQSFTIQPFRTEISRIIAHYIVPGSPRELNLSHKDRAALLHALHHTTHPSAFAVVRSILEQTLTGQSHPNFIRWSICNRNKPGVYFLRCLAICNVVLGVMLATILTLSSASRWYRILAGLLWWIGVLILVAAYNGFCVFLHRLHSRDFKPWEASDDHGLSPYLSDDDEATIASSDIYPNSTKSNWSIRMATFGSANQFGKESWVDTYHKKPLLRKIFDKQVSVKGQEKGVSFLQNKIIRQAEAWATLVTTVTIVAFVALPKGDFF